MKTITKYWKAELKLMLNTRKDLLKLIALHDCRVQVYENMIVTLDNRIMVLKGLISK